MIIIKGLTKRYGEKTVYQGFDLEIKKNSVLAVLGESGSGKTTLLNILAGLTDYEGEIRNNLTPVSMLFQKDYLVPNLTVYENLRLVNKEVDIIEALASVGLEESANAYPKSLSAGMSRRVSILRAFLFDSPMILMDEPTNSLDVGLKRKVYSILAELKRKYNKTVVAVTHDVDEALSIADRVIVIDNGKLIYSYNFVSDIEERDITGNECNLVRKEIINKLI